MTLTFLDIYNECLGQPWSMFDNDAETVEDFESAMRISINKAISVLLNKSQYPRLKIKYIYSFLNPILEKFVSFYQHNLTVNHL